MYIHMVKLTSVNLLIEAINRHKNFLIIISVVCYPITTHINEINEWQKCICRCENLITGNGIFSSLIS